MRGLEKALQTLALLAALSTATGCASTQIVASDPQALISIDGVPVGRGMASVQQTGFPGTAQVVAKTEDGRSAFQPMRRSFGWTAGVLGIFTYGVCFFACWQYPDSVYVVLPTARGWNASSAPGLQPAVLQGQDPWLSPPATWQLPEPGEPKAAVPISPAPTTAPADRPPEVPNR